MLEQVSLAFVTAHLRHQRVLLFGFDTLGDNPLAQAVPHGDDRLDDDQVLGFGGAPHDERTVDFDGIHREGGQVAEGGVAGAEIVEGDPEFQVFDPLKRRYRLLCILHEHVFGDLDLKILMPVRNLVQGVADGADNILAGEFVSREVDRHADRSQSVG